LNAELELELLHDHSEAGGGGGRYFHAIAGLGAVFQRVPARALTLTELGCPEILRSVAERREGLVVVAGPAGSGESTTALAMLDHINNTRACHIVTIEAPIELVVEPVRAQVTQREVGVHVPSPEAGMRLAMRESADVVLVGELATADATRLALELASSGMLVFGTVQTDGAASALDRIIRAFPEDEQPGMWAMLADDLAAIVAQQLVRRADGNGRVAAYEIAVATPVVTRLVREGEIADLRSAMMAGEGEGMRAMDASLGHLVAGSQVLAEDALDCASDREQLAQAMLARGLAPRFD
jgi:twitching motility protein PilT